MVNLPTIPHDLATTNTKTESAEWSKLPSEVKIKIFKSLDRNSLKSCRLVNGQTCNFATPVLSHTLCLGPSMTSVIRLACFALHRELRSLVQCIEVHPYQLRDYDEVDDFCAEFESLSNGSDHLYICANAMDNYKAQKEAKGSEAKGSEAEFSKAGLQQVMKHVKSSLKRFPNLNMVLYANSYTQNRRSYYEARPESQFYQDFGFTETSPHKIAISWPWLTLMLGEIRLKALELNKLSWDQFYPFFTGLANIDAFAGLQNLTLLFDTYLIHGSTDDLIEERIHYVIAFLEKLSSYSPKVEQLCLGFLDPDAPSAHSPLQGYLSPVKDQVLRQMTMTLLSGKVRRVHTLTLQNLIGDEETVISFVRRHRRKLKRLTLNGFRQWDAPREVDDASDFEDVTNATAATNIDELAEVTGTSDASDVATPKCIFSGLLKLIESIRQYSNLNRMDFTGSFVDVSGPAFNFADSPTRSQVQAYVCHKGDFPRHGFEQMIKKIVRGEGRAYGNDIVYEQDKMELRMTLFAMIDGYRTYLWPPTTFADGLESALETLRGLDG